MCPPRAGKPGRWDARRRSSAVVLDSTSGIAGGAPGGRAGHRVPARPAGRGSLRGGDGLMLDDGAIEVSPARPSRSPRSLPRRRTRWRVSPGIWAIATPSADPRRSPAHPPRPRDRGDGRGLGAEWRRSKRRSIRRAAPIAPRIAMASATDVPRQPPLDAAARYRPMAWLSPSFPVGAFAYSHGLEWAVEAGDVGDAASCEDWLAVMIATAAGMRRRPLRPGGSRDSGAAMTPELREVAELAPLSRLARAPLETGAQGRPSSRRRAPPGRARRSTADCCLGRGGRASGRGRRRRAGHGIALAPALAPISRPSRRISSRPACGSSARPDRRPAHSRRARIGRHGAAERALDAARRGRQRDVPRRSRHHAPRDPVYAAVPELRNAHHPTAAARRHRRAGRLRQDRADGALCKALRDRYDIAAITNDIFTKGDAEYLVRSARSRPSASRASRPAAARIPRSARMPRSTWRPSPTCGRNFRGST